MPTDGDAGRKRPKEPDSDPVCGLHYGKCRQWDKPLAVRRGGRVPAKLASVGVLGGGRSVIWGAGGSAGSFCVAPIWCNWRRPLILVATRFVVSRNKSPLTDYRFPGMVSSLCLAVERNARPG
ncbi:MAG: hypothetical protein BJ554DRAFT_22 [Olpidium bornovanus]|uniref:Uncharacterized protein n=1 Tax=Olpidium bornovanus TaxID=278681 RepID=A0A8H7ZUJ2_9FUNG|nr:MAG: hypothetical protein BJ554DRAFT_22 [Olpidium bornovanus]